MKKNGVFLLVIIAFLTGCASNMGRVGTATQPYNPTSIVLEDQLPGGAHGIVSASGFEAILGAEQFRCPTTLIVRTDEYNRLIINATLDINGMNTDDICHDNVISLRIAMRYLTYLNQWFFANQKDWDQNLASALRGYQYLYAVTFRRKGATLQVQGTVPNSRMIPRDYLFLRMPGEQERRIGLVRQDSAGMWGVRLGAPYNPMTGQYHTSYLVYVFFDRQDVLQTIPERKFWNVISD